MQSHNRHVNVQPTLQPRPVIMAPMRQPLSGIIGQPMINRMSSPINLARPVGPAQLVVGSMSMAGPRKAIPLQAPLCGTHVVQQRPPKVVSGVYPTAMLLGTPPHSQPVGRMVQPTQPGAIATLAQPRMAPVQGVALSQPLMGPLQANAAGYTVRNIHPTPDPANRQPRPAMLQPKQIGLNYGPPRQLHVPGQNKQQYMITGGNITPVTPVSLVTTQIMTAPGSLVPMPHHTGSVAVTHMSPRFLGSQPTSSPASPLVPLSPGMFQVGRAPGQPQFYSSPGNPSPIQPTMFAFSSPSSAPALSTSSPATILSQPQTSALTATSSGVGSIVLMPNPSGSSNSPSHSADLPTDLSTKSTTEDDTENADDVEDDEETEDPINDEPVKSFHENYLNLRQKPIASSSVEETSQDNQTQVEQPENFQENYLNLRQKHVVTSTGEGAGVDSTVEPEQQPNMMSMRGDADEQRSTENDSAKSGDKHEIDTGDYTEGGVPVDYDDPEFVWEDYLQETGAQAAPPTAFQHVECSLQSGFVKGMKLEVPNKCTPATYWVASVVLTCGPLLRLRYEGYEEDTNGDFWTDITTSEIHAIGWCAENGQNLQPPEDIKDKVADWREFLMNALTGARTAPTYLLDKETGSTPIDQLKPGMRLEVQDLMNPLETWLVKIIENIGGRLYLRYEGAESASHDFWMFYLHNRLHPVGWTKEEDWYFQHPACISSDHSTEEWDEILTKSLAECENQQLPVDVFKDQAELEPHKFTEGMKLEAINPVTKTLVYPATVVKVINSKYFLVEIDDCREGAERQSVQICCNSTYIGIFPTSWCQCKGFRLQHPPGYIKTDFLWNEYLGACNAKAAPEKIFTMLDDDHDFQRGMKLEAVNRENQNQICAATITKITGPLLWVHLDNTPGAPSHVEDINSFNLFPVGWCESNGYQLKPPRKGGLFKSGCRRSNDQSLNGEALRSDTYSCVQNGDAGDAWCPKIYFNHRCFSGPFLSKGRISELPKCVGPGPIPLMMKEVLSRLINVGYKSSRVLKELQLEGSPNPNMQQQMLKAKYKGKSYRAVVELCRTEVQLEEFCRNVCIKLECCPFLFSPLYVEDDCPENCQQLTKTKYNYNYGKKKKVVGRPTGGHTNLENGGKLPIKRGRKKKRFHLIHKKSHVVANLNGANGDDGYIVTNGEVGDEGFIDDDRSINNDDDESPSKKRRYIHHLPPPSDIQTRGAIGNKPKYSFERRTHKKILLSHSNPTPKAKSREKSLSPSYGMGNRVVPLPKIEPLHVDSNPLHWSVGEVVQFMKDTDCSHLCRIMQEQEIDGQALLLLSLPVIQDHLELKLGPAVKLCHLIERLKIAFFENYA